MVGFHKSNKLIDKFCRCINAVKRTVRLRKNPGRSGRSSAAESAAFGICTKSVLQTRKKTLFKASCSRRKYKNRLLKTQPMLKHRR
jgi:hypothetical protein